MTSRKDNFFYRIQRGELPQPPAAITLGMTVIDVDSEHGTLETEFMATAEFLNPAEKVQG